MKLKKRETTIMVYLVQKGCCEIVLLAIVNTLVEKKVYTPPGMFCQTTTKVSVRENKCKLSHNICALVTP